MNKVYVALLLGLLSSDVLCEEQPSIWPNGKKAAISLAYDDALNTHLDNAIPHLDKFGFKASFYLTLGSEVVTNRLAQWRQAAFNGHELGNHTLNHACKKSEPYTEWVTVWNDLDQRMTQELHHEIRTANAFLNAIDGKTQRTFTAPCGHWQTADGDYRLAIKSEFVAIKGSIASTPQPIDSIDPYKVHVAVPVGKSGKELIAFVKQAAKMGTIANLTFHGIGGDNLATSSEAHLELLSYLNANKHLYWVDTFQNIMTYYKSQRDK